jgi:hypothetical protein
LDEMNMKNTLIHSFLVASQVDESLVIYATWKVVHRPLDTMLHLFNLICDYKS